MPIYEYRCLNCGRQSSLLFLSIAESEDATCPHCASHELKRLVSRFAFTRSEESRLESLADPSSLAGLDENDPKSMARWMRNMGSELGEDLGPEFNETVDRLEAGEDPESIERDLGDADGLGAGEGSAGLLDE